MTPWLFDRIVEEDGDRRPDFSIRAINNWFQAIRFEIEQSHGKTIEEQVTACRDYYSGKRKTNNAGALGDIFEALFFSITYSMTLGSFAIRLPDTPWIRCTAIVDWYYSIYFSFRSMSYALEQVVPDSHSRMANFVASTLRTSLPYPFDIKASHKDGENYSIFVERKDPYMYELRHQFYFNRQQAQGMIAQYLKGTADWNTSNTKKAILQKHKGEFTNFRSAKAQKIRNRWLLGEIGFLHCAYRQRVKANYKDSIYLSYNFGENINLENLIDNLNVSARFASMAAIAFAERKIGKTAVQSFVADLGKNLHGVIEAEPQERYWSLFS